MSTDWPEGYGQRVLASVDSTNAEAARIAGELPGRTWIFAHEQTAARGRRGRAWLQDRGNFSATLVLDCGGEAPAQMALRSFVAALALFDAVAAATGRADGLALKWPNDVLLNGGKLAGILLESLPAHRLAIGIGVNLATAPDPSRVEVGSPRPVSILSETGTDIAPDDFLPLLAAAYAGHETRFREQGFGPIRLAWLQRAARLGQPLTARMGPTELTGTFTDIDPDGNLLLKTSAGTSRIAAADIQF